MIFKRKKNCNDVLDCVKFRKLNLDIVQYLNSSFIMINTVIKYENLEILVRSR